jgi:hypothetical protein
MEKYVTPQLEVITFESEDVITASPLKFPDVSIEE